MRTLTKVNGKHRLLTSEQMDDVLGKCIDCGHIFQPGENKLSKIVDCCIRFVCQECMNL